MNTGTVDTEGSYGALGSYGTVPTVTIHLLKGFSVSVDTVPVFISKGGTGTTYKFNIKLEEQTSAKNVINCVDKNPTHTHLPKGFKCQMRKLPN